MKLGHTLERIDQINPSLFDPNYIMRRARAEKMKEILNKTGPLNEGTAGRKILDIGARDKPYSVFARDSDEWIALDIVKHTPDTVVGNAEQLPFADESFDLIICNQVFEYFEDPSRAAGEMHRVLRPGGRLVASNPACYPPWGDTAWRIMPRGWKLLLKDFSDVDIGAECNTVASFFRTMNFYLHVMFHHTILNVPLKLFVFPITNTLGWLSNKRFKDTGFVANYFVVARK